jgi:hypothetical protein
MKRSVALAALLLTAYFAVAGAFHHHAVPIGDHEHAGLCSVPAAAPHLESCAICKAAGAASGPVVCARVAAVDRPSVARLPMVTAPAVAAGHALPHVPRGPPTV